MMKLCDTKGKLIKTGLAPQLIYHQSILNDFSGKLLKCCIRVQHPQGGEKFLQI